MCQTHFMYLVCSFVCCNIDMSWNIEIIRRNFYSTTLEILNGNVTLVKDPVIYPDVNMTVLCHLEPVVKEKGYEKWQIGEMKLLRKEENCLRISVRSGKQEEETVYTWKIMR